MFTNARLKLTFWYFLVITLLTSSISVLFYVQTGMVLEREYARIEHRLARQELGMPPGNFFPSANPPGFSRILPEDLTQAREKILWQLILINFGIVSVFTSFGYWWAGKTLAPIQLAHQRQQQFLADATHELKTPITAMKTSLEVSLMEKNLSTQTKKVLTENLGDVKSLETLIQNLLQFTQLRHQVEIISQVNLNLSLERAQKIVKVLAHQKHVTITKKIEGQNIQIKANSDVLTEVWVILLDNAIKFSFPGSQVDITLKTHNHWAIIQVSDHGIGMNPDQLAQVFERFYRADEARNKQASPGFGLGLAIAKELVERLNGQISASSKPGQGSTFSVKLPLV